MKRSLTLIFTLLCFAPAHSQEVTPGMRAPSISISHWIFRNSLPETLKIHEMDKPMVIDFFATWCGPCRLAIPHLERLAAKFEGKTDFLVISNEKPDVMEKFFHGMQGTLNVATDWLGRTQFSYGVSLLPSAFFISREGIIRWSGRPEALQEEVLDGLISGKPPAAIDSLEKKLGMVSTREMNRSIVSTTADEMIYSLEIRETSRVEFEITSSDRYIDIRGSLYQVIGQLYEVPSAQRLEFKGDTAGPYLRVMTASERMDRQQLRNELMRKLEMIYGFRVEEITLDKPVMAMQAEETRDFPGDTLFGGAGTSSQLIVIPDSLVYADNITLDAIAMALENQFGITFVNETGDSIPRDWKIPLDGMKELERFMSNHFGISLSSTVRPVRLTRVEFPED